MIAPARYHWCLIRNKLILRLFPYWDTCVWLPVCSCLLEDLLRHTRLVSDLAEVGLIFGGGRAAMSPVTA